METDRELVGRSLRGEKAAFEALVERHRAGVLRFCGRQIGDWDAAEDLAQETFLRAYFDLHALRDPASVGAWLRSIAVRLCQSHHRRRRESAASPEEIARCIDAGGVGRDALSLVSARETAREVLSRLTDAQREVVLLKYGDGYSLAEIAALTAAPVETVRTRLRRARTRLQHAGLDFEAMEGEIPMKRREFLKQTAGAAGAVTLGAGAAPIGAAPDGAAFTRRVLERLEMVEQESGLTWPIYACLRAAGKETTLSSLMGLTGMAFQFTVDESVDDSGPTHVMDWGAWFRALTRLGCEVTVFNAQLKSLSPGMKTNTEAEFRACQSEAWDAARASLDRGVPAIAWMPITVEQKAIGEGCEYALLTGYDAKAGEYQVRVPGRAPWTIRWDGFGRADPVNWFNVIVFGAVRKEEDPESVREALRFAVAHARGTHPGHGLGAFTTWRQALDAGRLPDDRAPRAAHWQREARDHAAAFLRENAGHIPEATPSLSEAARHYGEVARAWQQYLGVYAEPEPAKGDAAVRRDAARRHLAAAEAAEQAAVTALERALAASPKG